jgi:RHS repeat-associated protein
MHPTPTHTQQNRRFLSSSYRYAFNSMERDDEVKGSGNSYTTEFRQYDLRLGRWLTLDPLFSNFPWQSPYCAFDNNPIYFTDPLGLAAEGGDDKKEDQLDKGKMGAEDTPFELHEITVTATRGSVTQTPANQDDITKSDNKETWAMRNGSWSSTCMCYSFNGASQQYWDEVENTKKALYTASWVTVGSIGGAMALPALLPHSSQLFTAGKLIGSSYIGSRLIYTGIDASLQYGFTGSMDVVSLGTNWLPGIGEYKLGTKLAIIGTIGLIDGAVDYKIGGGESKLRTIFNNTKDYSQVITDATFSSIGQGLPLAFKYKLNQPLQYKGNTSNYWDAKLSNKYVPDAMALPIKATLIPMNDAINNNK